MIFKNLSLKIIEIKLPSILLTVSSKQYGFNDLFHIKLKLIIILKRVLKQILFYHNIKDVYRKLTNK